MKNKIKKVGLVLMLGLIIIGGGIVINGSPDEPDTGSIQTEIQQLV